MYGKNADGEIKRAFDVVRDARGSYIEIKDRKGNLIRIPVHEIEKADQVLEKSNNMQ